MEGNYPPGFYCTERDQQERQHQPSQQQHQQHVPHYPMDLPYHTTAQHQSEFVVDQPIRAFPIPHPAAPMLSSIYHGSGPGLPNPNIIHQARHQLPVTVGGHGVKSSTLSTNYALPITTHEPAIERNTLPITTHESVVESNTQPITTRDSSAKSNAPQPQDQTSAVPAPSSKQGNSREQRVHCPPSSHQTNTSPPISNSSTEEPQLFAALNLKKTSSMQDLPTGISIKMSSQGKMEGVVAQEMIEKGEEFGPYLGTLMNEDLGWSKDTTWEVCVSDLKTFFYIDGHNTWMSHLRCARSEEEQNMEAYQYYGKIYFRSTKVIEPGSELRVFYSAEYMKHVGIQTRLNDLKFNADSQKFQCSHCEGLFTSVKLILRHIRHEHTGEKQDDMIPILTWKKKGKKKEKEKPVSIRFSFKLPNTTKGKASGQEESDFKCGTCEKVFPSRGKLKEHCLFHEMMDGTKPYECSQCNSRYVLLSSLTRHEREVHGLSQDYTPRKRSKQKMKKKEQHKCHECNQGFKSHDALNRHERKTHRYQCEVEVSDPAPGEPKDMLGRPTDYYQRSCFQCRFCPKRYSTLSRVEQHEKEAHTGEGTFKCSHCPKVFATVSRLKEHLVLHQYVNMYRCTLCPRSFASESALNNHQGEHTGLKPFKCEICGKGFRTRKLALSHKRRVHMDRPKRFFCTFCNKGFAENNHLKAHERRHKGIRQYVCLECGKGFTSNTSLKAHTQTMHIKEKPFSCEICGKAFALNHQYNHHMAKHRLQGEVQDETEFSPVTIEQQ